MFCFYNNYNMTVMEWRSSITSVGEGRRGQERRSYMQLPALCSCAGECYTHAL